MKKIDRTNWAEILSTQPNEQSHIDIVNFGKRYNITNKRVKEFNRYYRYNSIEYFGNIWYVGGHKKKFYNQIMKSPGDATTIIIIEGNTLKEVIEMAKESFDNMKKVVLKPRAENYSMDELKSMESINNRLYFQIQDYVINNRERPLFLIGGRGFGKTFNVLKVVTNQENINKGGSKTYHKIYHERLASMQEKEKTRFLMEKGRRENQLKQSLKSPTLFIFKKNEKQEIWKPIEGKYIKSADLNEVFNTSSIIVFDDIHYICENVINKKLSVDVLITLFKNILKTSKLRIPTIMISDEMMARYAGLINNDELDELVLMFGEVSCRKMQELPKSDLREYLNKRDVLAKLELPSISYEEFDCLFEFSNIDADDFVKKFLYKYSNGNPRGFARFVSIFHSKEITIDDLIRIAKKRLLNHKKYNEFLQLMDFPILPVAINNKIVRINDETLSKACNRFKTFKKFYSFSQEKYNLKQELYERIDSNYTKASILFKERNAERKSNHMLSQIIKLSQMTKNSKYLQGYKQLIKIIEKDFNDVFKQIPEIPDMTRWKTSHDRYISTCDCLLEIKEELRINDADFEKIWKIIPYNYQDGNLVKPFLLAFNKELSDGWYLDTMKFVP